MGNIAEVKHFKIVELPEEVVAQCPHCNICHSRGCVVVETVVDGEAYVYAELVTCCGEYPQPIPFLFDSHEPAQSYVHLVGLYAPRFSGGAFSCLFNYKL